MATGLATSRIALLVFFVLLTLFIGVQMSHKNSLRCPAPTQERCPVCITKDKSSPDSPILPHPVRNPRRNIASFCLYGNADLFVHGAVRNVDLIPFYYPGYGVRFYIDDSVSEGTVSLLKERGAEVILLDKSFAWGEAVYLRFS